MASSVAYKYVQRLAAPACDQHLCHDAGVSWLLAMTLPLLHAGRIVLQQVL